MATNGESYRRQPLRPSPTGEDGSQRLAYSNVLPLVTGVHLTVEVCRPGHETPFPVFRFGDAWHVGAIEGAPYSLRLRSKSVRRIVVVVSVDGINVITGDEADPNQRGYILKPGGVLNIAGWRKSMQEVAQFGFARPPESYAERVGKGANVGVLGFAVFEEAPQTPVEPSLGKHSLNFSCQAPLPAQPATVPIPAPQRPAPQRPVAQRPAPQRQVAHGRAALDLDLGTSHGERITAPLREVPFERRTTDPVEELSMRYASLLQLERAGIAQRARPAPDPFPARQRFVPDPPPYR